MKKVLYTYAISIILSAGFCIAVLYLHDKVLFDFDTGIWTVTITGLVGLCFGVLLARNITMRVQHKEKFQEIHHKANEVTKLTQKIVHDLKNPLSAIHGLAYLTIDHSKNLNEQQIRNIDSIKLRVRASLSIIDELLNVVKEGRREVSVDLRILNLGDVIEEAVDLIETVADLKNISVSREKMELPDVYTDRFLLVDILANFLSNAVKYSMSGSAIAIKYQDFPNTIRIRVIDQGIGISAQDLPQVFVQFRKFSSRPTAGETSNGVGLEVVSHLSEKIGAQVGVFSEGPGKGAEFYVDIPKANLSQLNTTQKPEDIEIAQSQILVIEDDDMNAMILSRFLKSMNLNFVVASSKKTALKLFEDTNYDLIFCDLNLPDDPQKQILAEIAKRRSKTSHLIVCTAEKLNDFSDEKKHYDDVMLKPYGLAQVQAIVKKYLNKEIN